MSSAALAERLRLDPSATVVARRGDDGVWRYVIDTPFGVAPMPG